MARLHEYQGKKLLVKYGLKVPKGFVARTPLEAAESAHRIGFPVVLKAQIHATGRFKAGGIRFASNKLEAEKEAEKLIGKLIKGFKVKEILVEEKLSIEKELYLGITVDDSFKVRSQVFIFNDKGGVDIEETAEKEPWRIIKVAVDPVKGLNPEEIKKEISNIGDLASGIADYAEKIYRLSRDYDALTVEVNPLIQTTKGELVAGDCRITVDDNSLFRQRELGVGRDIGRELTELEKKIWRFEQVDRRGTGYFIQLTEETKGCIGFHGIGGGGAMLATDALLERGLKLANYADTSGDPPASKIYRVIKTILSQPGIIGYVLMGSVIASQEQWHHAHAIVKAFNESLRDKPGFPVLILIAGNKESETHEIIRRGLRDLPIKLELYGRDYIYETDFIVDRLKEMVDEYLKGGG